MRDLNTFFKNIHQKWKYYREEKQDFERFLVFLNIKISKKSKKDKLNEEFIATWRDKQSLWDVMSSLYQERNEEEKDKKVQKKNEILD